MEKTKSVFLRFFDRPYLSYFLISFVSYYIVEVFNRRSVFGAFEFMITSPHVFAVNLSIVMLTFSFALFFRRKLFVYSLVSILWLIIDIINFVLLLQRNTQFNASDIVIFKYGIFITARYINIFEIILIIIGIALAVFFMVLLFRRGHRFTGKINYKISGAITILLLAVASGLIILGNSIGFLTPRFTDISKGYSENGFPYAFGCSIFDLGVDEPNNYSEDSIEGISMNLNDDIDSSGGVHPNVIFVQLESFIPPSEFVGVDFEDPPTPNFEKLSQEYPSGYLTVPVVGGGTANTEFEILTGMSLKYFGTIEFPYETFLKNTPCESIAHNFKALGYKTNAIHNFSAGFYRRNEVFSNLGFDTFTPFEYMSDIEYNDIGWAKDSILERYIMSALASGEERDLIFAVSVQGHGSYPTDFDDSESDIETTYRAENISEYSSALNYYISQVNEMDKFVGSLTAALESFGEPTVVVFYGDHIPGISFTEDMLKSSSLFKTRYVIWSNYGLEAEDRDICSYQLSSYVQKLIGFSSGKITQFHQKYESDANYQNYLQTLEYDIKEGNNITFGGKNPFEPTELSYGVESIIVDEAYMVGNTLYITGENFNEFSSVYINGSHKSTQYLNSRSLMVSNAAIKSGDKIQVAQMSYQAPWEYLSITDGFTYIEQ